MARKIRGEKERTQHEQARQQAASTSAGISSSSYPVHPSNPWALDKPVPRAYAHPSEADIDHDMQPPLNDQSPSLPPDANQFDFRQHATPRPTRPNPQPWQPFQTRLDFEVAELAHEAAMSKDQTNHLINLLHRCMRGSESFTIENQEDLHNKWNSASHSLTSFVFDAQHLSKYNGTSFVCFFDEPWTADSFWDVQSKLPEGGKPLAFILYADKAKPSSFGRAKGYPVVARCANLPVETQNGDGVGGGRVVGWLPIVKEDKVHSGKPAFVNFKNVVWHKSFKKVLESITEHSHTGCWVECFDKIARWFFPFILILSADYGEQCVMALIRGLRSKFPCPVCLIPRDELSSMLVTYPLRSSAETQATIASARAQRTMEAKEDKLKSQALRDVDSAFQMVANTDVYHATSFDRLHAHGGLFSNHLWVEFQRLVNEKGRNAATLVDNGYKALPRWRNLNHFDNVMDISFTDGTKNEDISKLLVFAAHDVFSPDSSDSDIGYSLLCSIRAFVDLDMYTTFEVHTKETIVAGRAALNTFSDLIDLS
ncbi:hypothetical protein BJ138DRAFT_1223855 [Hygrophoropsis aurantiaca]|uniref:Uncharacterized protein n=1 Tax=Hygrophoropsis aurantiaca TaxID=72124 RepID=A0ACB7ZXY9_9AGAM|nr:hypothetical protein BJ138DRAFT_1223855 [Hygrophoropsis aurantiaca]